MGYLEKLFPAMVMVVLKNFSPRILKFRMTILEYGRSEKYICPVRTSLDLSRIP
jgi:hypothetical protein